MRTVLSWLDRHPVFLRLVLLAVALFFGAGAVVTFGFGGCHDSGGFCAAEFSSTHVEAYASGAVLAALAALAACSTVTRRPLVLVATASGVAGLVALAAVLLERTN